MTDAPLLKVCWLRSHRCNGGCGVDEVCNPLTYRFGYCVKPKLREEVTKDDPRS